MLFLTSKPGDIIHIANNVKITVERITGKQVRLAFDCLPYVEIFLEKNGNNAKTEEIKNEH